MTGRILEARQTEQVVKTSPRQQADAVLLMGMNQKAAL